MRAFHGVYTEGNFRIYGNIFSYMQKFIFAYTKISLRIYGSFSALYMGILLGVYLRRADFAGAKSAL